MSQDQSESSKSEADHFERWLLEESESGFQEFIDQAPSILAELTPLRECKSRVDARLAAEPEPKVFSLSDAHIVRQRYWYTIADRLQAEINIRSLRSAASTSGNSLNPSRPGPKQDHVVVARRVIVRQNQDLSDKDLCELLDHEKIGVPIDWADEGCKTWVEAWRTRNSRVSVIFSKDRKST